MQTLLALEIWGGDTQIQHESFSQRSHDLGQGPQFSHKSNCAEEGRLAEDQGSFFLSGSKIWVQQDLRVIFPCGLSGWSHRGCILSLVPVVGQGPKARRCPSSNIQYLPHTHTAKPQGQTPFRLRGHQV